MLEPNATPLSKFTGASVHMRGVLRGVHAPGLSSKLHSKRPFDTWRLRVVYFAEYLQTATGMKGPAHG